jgi:hypothetical protein
MTGAGRLQRMARRLRPRLAPPDPAVAPDLRPIVARLDALEAMVEGLQDSVDRESRRHDERLDELARRLQPADLARVLSDDARKRGL